MTILGCPVTDVRKVWPKILKESSTSCSNRAQPVSRDKQRAEEIVADQPPDHLRMGRRSLEMSGSQ